MFYIHGHRAHPPCPGSDGGTSAGTRGNDGATGQPYLLINFERFLTVPHSPRGPGNKKYPRGKWDDQYDVGYNWHPGSGERAQSPFKDRTLWGNGFFCQICLRNCPPNKQNGCENCGNGP